MAHQLAYRAIVQSGMGDVGFVGQSNWKEMSDPLRDRYTKDIDKFLDVCFFFFFESKLWNSLLTFDM